MNKTELSCINNLTYYTLVKCGTVVFLCISSLMSICAYAANTVYFDTTDPGVTKAVAEWGADTAWPSSDNMRQCITHMGVNEIDEVRLNFYTDQPLQANGQLYQNSKDRIDNQLSIAAMAGDKPLVLTPSTGDGVDAWYKNGSEVWPDRWVQLLEATQEYINKPIYSVEPFNEPDYGWNQGTAGNLYDILGLLQSSPNFSGTVLVGASTLNSDWAQWWYDQIKTHVTMGSTHQLAGSTDNYVNFLQYVHNNGDSPFNPELHSMAEAIYGAEYGMEGGIWWGPVLRSRGLFVRSCQGKRLAYAENRGNYSAAAVYRAPDGELYGFASCFERQGWITPYRFVCTDRDVYFNGIGPIREFMLTVTANDDLYVNIDYDIEIFPALDGNRWKIMNRQTGNVMEVQSGGLYDGANIRGATDTGALYQKWDIVSRPEKNLQQDGYYRLFNANSGRTAELANWSLENGSVNGNIWQYGTGDNDLQAWFIKDAGNGYYYIGNEFSCKYMTDGGSNIYQWDFTGNYNQQWQFVLANPAVSGLLVAHYEFEDNANDSAGSNNGTAYGDPAYIIEGVIGKAIDLDGANDYVKLPAGVANSDDITIAAWVNWDGGDAWQRVFDFGNNTTGYMFLTPSNDEGMMDFSITTDSYSAEEVLTTDQCPIGQWVHVAVTLNGNTGILYINGQPRVAGQIFLNPPDFNPTNNLIGDSQWSQDPYFNGRIDDFRIYDYALSAEEIATLSLPPSFTADLIDDLVDAIELQPYAGQSLAGYVDAPQGTDGLTFSKDAGPDWLVVAPNGTLSGIPDDSNVGLNTFTVRVENQAEIFDTATMYIQVTNTYSGTQGMEDVLGLATEWLTFDCVLCGGANLDGINGVTLSDFSMLSHNWLGDETLQLHLKLDETIGDTAHDGSVYRRDGSLFNGPTWDTGHVGGALAFDGVDDYVEVTGYKGVTGTGSRTCSAWIKTEVVSKEILSWGDNNNGRRWVIRINEGGQLRAEVQGGNIIGTKLINDDEWHHVSVVLIDDGSPDIAEAQLYVDGQPEAISGYADEPINTGLLQDVQIGAYSAAGAPRYFQGLIDDVQIYDVALSP